MRKLVVSLFVSAVVLWAQSYTASVRGTVTDPTQAVIPAAAVTLTDVDRNLKYTAETDAAGRFVLTALPPGRYTLTAEAADEAFREGAKTVVLAQVSMAAAAPLCREGRPLVSPATGLKAAMLAARMASGASV